jgi:predicted alpha-1,6-mannanase (GH76 family)
MREDGVFYDGTYDIKSVGNFSWSYTVAVFIKSNEMLYQVTSDPYYL